MPEDRSIYENWTYSRNDIFSSFEQMFSIDMPGRNMLIEEKQWKLSIPNERSGPCYTYNPPFASESSIRIGAYITMKHAHWEPDLLVFLHEKDKFYYTEGQSAEAMVRMHKLEINKMYHTRALRKYVTKLCYYPGLLIF